MCSSSDALPSLILSQTMTLELKTTLHARKKDKRKLLNTKLIIRLQ